MDLISISEIVAALCFGGGSLFAGIGYFKQGKDQGKLSTNQLLKDQIDALEKKVNDQSEDIVKLTQQVKILKDAVEEREKKLAEVIEILQGRNPEMATFLELMKTYISANTPLLEKIKTETIPTIEQLKRFLDKQAF